MFIRFPIFTIIVAALASVAIINRIDIRGVDFLNFSGMFPFVAIGLGIIFALLIYL